MSTVESNINLISSWITSHHLTINSNKTKYMIVSRKSPSFLTSLPPLFLNGSQLEQVKSFKYLVLLSPLIYHGLQSVCSKAHQTFGIIYHNFYKHASPPYLKFTTTILYSQWILNKEEKSSSQPIVVLEWQLFVCCLFSLFT